jgi:diaminohydroxyphosphoribosylaminopyrimidine deaminase/5-amino-6-(5-phosphoribosylamino)uracil reductase
VDAIAVGSSTVLVDNPLLTPRMVYRERPLTRVIFDRRGRVPSEARVFSTLAAGPVIMIVSRSASRDRHAALDRLANTGVTIEVDDGPNLHATLEQLADRDIVSLLIEGGPTVQQAFWLADLVDRVQMVGTPLRLFSGVAAPAALDGLGRPDRTWQLGADTLKEFDVHRLD